ncbi:DNA cytosine methyltransferase [Enterobacter hormaechei]|nr:DNA cytosine methyltransferase [Enterobacter hormaechei]
MSPPSAKACSPPAVRVAGRDEGVFLPGCVNAACCSAISASDPKGLLAPCMRGARRPFGDDGVRFRCPPVKQRVPFVRGCAPDDAGPSHDTGRVRPLTLRQAHDDSLFPVTAHRWFPCQSLEAFSLQRPVPLLPRFAPPPPHRSRGNGPLRPNQKRRCDMNHPYLQYGSVCSGIEAVSLAWKPLGWHPAWFSEIDPFPNAVLTHHYPDVPNLGDMTGSGAEALENLAPTLRASGHTDSHANAGVVPASTFKTLRATFNYDISGTLISHYCKRQENADTILGPDLIARSVAVRGREGGATAELGGAVADALRASGGGSDKAHVLLPSFEAYFRGELLVPDESGWSQWACWRVRQLMPVECERLQGMPDNYTLVPYRGKPAADAPRYKAIGNSMAVPCVAWLGQRLSRLMGA